MQRRDFFTAAALGGTLAAAAQLQGTASAADNKQGLAKQRFCSQLGIIPGSNEGEKLAWMKKNGFEAVEIGRLGDNYLDWKKRADDAGLPIASLCIGSFGNQLTDEDPEKRKKGYGELKVQIERAGAVGAPVIVYVPATGKPDRPNQRIRELTVTMLKELGPFAAQHKTNIVLEPLRRNEAWFLRQVSDAAQICKDADTDGIGCLGDSFHMAPEEPDDFAAIVAGGAYLKHIHLGNRSKRQLPGLDDHSHVKLMRGLKYIGYTGFISFECGVGGSNNKEVEVPKSVEYLRKCWEEA
ncbi:MAG: sugar phosphate isomerase/epimerase [Planctomycetaceae bacterium]|jgi:sugar phosphate isomerase/epimerase|nr:sugar phosphate isomerase/epimerase [Planctomycetaceae bacterium]